MISYNAILKDIYEASAEAQINWADLTIILEAYPRSGEALLKRLQKDGLIEILPHNQKQNAGVECEDHLYGRLTDDGLNYLRKLNKKKPELEKYLFGLAMTFVFFLIGKMLSLNEENQKRDSFKNSPVYQLINERNNKLIISDSALQRYILNMEENEKQDTLP